ncbi:hypothetical protein TNCV_1820351 [Trichonephila clavipes]|nr:hypothetical protein TNCV_1820351 [Trichonephila clavipes]
MYRTCSRRVMSSSLVPLKTRRVENPVPLRSGQTRLDRTCGGPVLRVPTGGRRHKRAYDTILVFEETPPGNREVFRSSWSKEQRRPVNKKFLQEERRFVTILVLKETPPWQQRTPEIRKKI